MPFIVGPEQEQLAASVRGFLSGRVTAIDAADDARGEALANLWSTALDQLDLLALGVPETLGGYGSLVELGLVQRELGRHRLLVPFFSTACLAGRLLCSQPAEATTQVLMSRLQGGETASVAHREAVHDGWERAETTALLDGEGTWRVNGTKHAVLGGASADFLLVTASSSEGLIVLAVDGSAPGHTRTRVEASDPGVELATCRFEDAPAQVVVGARVAGPALQRAMAEASVLLSAFQAGAAEACFRMAVDYASIREQFGQPIAGFQAIQHALADMLVSLESALSAAYYGLWSGSVAGLAEFEEIADIVSTVCSTAYSDIAARNIHLHGGIGFTWEHSAHLFHKSALFTEGLLLHREVRKDRLRTRMFGRTEHPRRGT